MKEIVGCYRVDPVWMRLRIDWLEDNIPKLGGNDKDQCASMISPIELCSNGSDKLKFFMLSVRSLNSLIIEKLKTTCNKNNV